MPLTPDQIAIYRGHPTAPGERDDNPTAKRPGEPYRDGIPGIPKVIPTPTSHADGMPGPTPSGPIQPEIEYDEGKESLPVITQIIKKWRLDEK